MPTFEPLGEHFGARIVGLDLDRPIGPDMAADLRKALCDHRLLLLRQGPLSEQQQIDLLAALGKVMIEVPGGGPVTRISADPSVGYVSGPMRLLFHSDGQFTAFGALQAISLYAEEMERCEPTIFADMVAAARRLPDDLRRKIADLQIVQCADLTGSTERVRSRLSNQKPGVPDSQFPRAVHPLLGGHRITGEPMINVSELFTSHIVGMTDAQSDAVFAQLADYQYQPGYLYAHPWQLHDLVIWDNIGLQHSRSELAAPSGRTLRRVSINALDNAETMRGVTPAKGLLPEAGEGW